MCALDVLANAPPLTAALAASGHQLPHATLHGLAKLVRKGARNSADIVPDHRDVGRSLAVLIGQTIRIQRSANCRAGLGCNFAHYSGIADAFQKDRRNPFFFDLLEDRCDVPRARLGFGRDSPSDERDVIGRGDCPVTSRS